MLKMGLLFDHYLIYQFHHTTPWPTAGHGTLDTIAGIRLQNRPVIVGAAGSAQGDNSGIQYTVPGLGSSIIKNADGEDSTNNNIIQFSAVKK